MKHGRSLIALCAISRSSWQIIAFMAICQSTRCCSGRERLASSTLRRRLIHARTRRCFLCCCAISSVYAASSPVTAWWLMPARWQEICGISRWGRSFSVPIHFHEKIACLIPTCGVEYKSDILCSCKRGGEMCAARVLVLLPIKPGGCVNTTKPICREELEYVMDRNRDFGRQCRV